MARRPSMRSVPSPTPEANPPAPLPEDDFVSSLKTDLARTHRQIEGAKVVEDLRHRGELNKRLLQDLWEVHNQFEEISVHLTVEPSQTLFATFVEYPTKWAFRDSFDFGAVKTIELTDRSQGWGGFTLRVWYYRTPEGRRRLRGIFEWCDGETYHRYSGWMRLMMQAVLYDAEEDRANLREIHQILRDIVVKWYASHLDRRPEEFIAHLKEKYPRGTTYSKESYR